jgi:DNA helicase HerA-like ATPase
MIGSLYSKYFLETMMDLTKEYWINYLVFIEEAHKLCGEQDKQASATAVKDLMSRGRKRGYCGVLLTQRISKLHKDAAAECNNKFIGRTLS